MAEIWSHIVNDIGALFSGRRLAPGAAFGQVLLIDIMLAGDNAIVVGALAAGLPPSTAQEGHPDRHHRGAGAADRLRAVVTQLLQIVGLIFAGGLLLLWVAWKMYRELSHAGAGRSIDAGRRSHRASARPRASPRPPGRWRSPTSR